MQFGLFHQLPHNPRQTHAERYAEMMDLIGLGETLGFESASMEQYVEWIRDSRKTHQNRYR